MNLCSRTIAIYKGSVVDAIYCKHFECEALCCKCASPNVKMSVSAGEDRWNLANLKSNENHVLCWVYHVGCGGVLLACLDRYGTVGTGLGTGTRAGAAYGCGYRYRYGTVHVPFPYPHPYAAPVHITAPKPLPTVPYFSFGYLQKWQYSIPLEIS